MHVYTRQILRANRRTGFTLAEILMAMAVMGMTIGGVLYGYLITLRRAEYSAYNLAAQSLAIQRLEQTRAARWQPNNGTVIDELVASNFPPDQQILDVPLQGGTNKIYATNFTTILTISTSPPLRMIRVDCVWNFPKTGSVTNRIATYRAPDQ
jgi:prepilin-type N-terminal cleavage/methylation domain-containing protein